MTWHENHTVNPGVPDLSYVMTGGSYENGWLELKAERDTGPTAQFHVESTQHQWIKNHCERVPVHFLLSWGDTWYLLHGSLHWRLVDPIRRSDLHSLACAYGNSASLRSGLNTKLRELTDRHGNRIS